MTAGIWTQAVYGKNSHAKPLFYIAFFWAVWICWPSTSKQLFCLFCAKHSAEPLGEVGFIQDWFIYWSFPFASHCAKLERNMYWRVNNCHIHSSLPGEGALGASLCTDDHALYQATSLLYAQLTGSGMDAWPKGRWLAGWPGVHEVDWQESSTQQLLTGVWSNQSYFFLENINLAVGRLRCYRSKDRVLIDYDSKYNSGDQWIHIRGSNENTRFLELCCFPNKLPVLTVFMVSVKSHYVAAYMSRLPHFYLEPHNYPLLPRQS